MRRPLVAAKCRGGSLLTRLGAFGEALELDRHLETSTTLVRQRCLHYSLVPATSQVRLRLFVEKLI